MFVPERFAPENRGTIPRFAYLPFGAGPRICVGMTFAMQEALLALTMIARRFRLTLAEGANVMPFARMTLRPMHGLPMRIEVEILTLRCDPGLLSRGSLEGQVAHRKTTPCKEHQESGWARAVFPEDGATSS